MLKDKIKQLRIENEITIQDLADLTGLSAASISMYESGKRIPSIKNISKIAEALNVSVDELFNSENIISEKSNSIIMNKINDLSKESAFIRANGICELCGNNAPFITNEGDPYLLNKSIYYDEVKSTYVFAVCPNCHAKLSVLDCIGEKKYLFKKYNRRTNEKNENNFND